VTAVLAPADELSAFLDEELQAFQQQWGTDRGFQARLDWQRRLYRGGWVAPSWPVDLGGRALGVADRVAWGEAPPDVGETFRPLVARLVAVLRPVTLESQVIHGDLTGNVLFAANRDPAVIDFSPYFRPAAWALAVVVVDAVAWHGASLALADHIDHLRDRDQLIARAALYRLVTADRFLRDRPSAEATRQVRAHESLAALVGA